MNISQWTVIWTHILIDTFLSVICITNPIGSVESHVMQQIPVELQINRQLELTNEMSSVADLAAEKP